ncbi:mitochondrial carrier domain-containing protein [Microdochium trichocladiopsis]|uniref:Mitochondrial carrier domain-containing protein n=1 Tax=Microdochium trichocladiopsis TaxID=1682393 RepID=A0A9P9BHV6_9PEZI|nr:mitochondrial carrier domain-containing protein [Microdochium trichocladiopsis]KAH7012475.1 mitochondrial carrier domain-containing protein [Microdochium trichocladiopsis]
MTQGNAGPSPALVETVAGLTAGSVATLTVHPLDIVKTRMQIHRSSAARPEGMTTVSLLRKLLQGPHPVAALYRGAVGVYPSMWTGFRTIWATEGYRGFYRGLGISMFGVMHGAVQFAVYDPLKLSKRVSSLSSLDVACSTTRCLTSEGERLAVAISLETLRCTPWSSRMKTGTPPRTQ